MNFKLLYFSLLLFITSSAPLFSQQKDSAYDGKKTLVINNDKFKVYNNWLSAGAGVIDDFTRYGNQFTLGADFNFHIQAKYFQVGFCFSGADLNNYNDYNYHLAFGWRIERSKFNFSCFLGPAYSTGFEKVDGYFSSDKIYNQIGLYGCAQFIKKVAYDVGIGPSLFFDINSYQNMAGLRLDIYFSGAYKGKVRKDRMD